MTTGVRLDYSSTFVKEEELFSLQDDIKKAHDAIHHKTGKGNGFLGWVDLPVNYDREEFARIQAAAEKIHQHSDVLLVIGVGGSYLGAKAAMDALSHSFRNQLDEEERKGPEIYFIGHHFNQKYVRDLLNVLKGKDISINVISKSGTTTEPAIAFRYFRNVLETKHGKEEARHRIYATTDKEKGALKTLADEQGYETFVVPDDIGGRYSVLTPVGLLPITAAGLDIKRMMEGAEHARKDLSVEDLSKNSAYQYAALRYLLYQKGNAVEMLVNDEPRLHYLAEWWKQLFGESEGKNGKGIFPAAANFTTDLHSIGQYIQEGPRHLFETFLHIEDEGEEVLIEASEYDADGLNYLAGKSLGYVNKRALEGTLMAHTDGGVPNLILSIPELNEFYMGYLLYFFQKACAMSAYLLDVNPFDQPGVEAYKNNMFTLLGKPGYQEKKEALQK